jgi:hypothetical protein
MASTVLTSSERHSAATADNSTRLHGLGVYARTVVSLLAVYAPPTLVLLLHRGPLASVYLVVGIWAIEGIVWYWLKNHVIDRGDDRHFSPSWRPDHN